MVSKDAVNSSGVIARSSRRLSEHLVYLGDLLYHELFTKQAEGYK